MSNAPDGVLPGNRQDRQATFKGRSYTLRFSFVAAAALKDHWEIPFDDDAALISRAVGSAITDLPALIWALLQAHHPEIPIGTVVRWCDEEGLSQDLGDFARIVNETIRAGWGAPKKKPEAPLAPPPPPPPAKSRPRSRRG